SNLAAAYGVAVTGSMMIDTIVVFVVVQVYWGWSLPRAVLLCGALFVVDLVFTSATLMKVVEGGWFPILIAAIVFTLLSTWYKGRGILHGHMREDSIPVERFVARVTDKHPLRVPGTALFLTSDLVNVPFTLLHNLKHNKVLHERVALVSIVTEEHPFVRND